MVARLGHQREIGRNGIVVRCRCRDLVGIGRREVIGVRAGTRGRLAGVRIDSRHLPAGGFGLNLFLGIAEVRQIAEGDVVQAVAGRTDFLVDLVPTLQLRDVPGAQRPVEREAAFGPVRFQMELVLCRMQRLFGEKGVGTEAEREQGNAREHETGKGS